MAKKGEPGKDELLALLRRAAGELKSAQEDARTAIAALRKEKDAHAETEAELEALKAGRGDFTDTTNVGAGATGAAVLEDLRGEVTRLQARVDGFKRDLETAQGELAAERQRAEAAEASLKTASGEREELLTKVGELEAKAAAVVAEAAGERERLSQQHQDALGAEAQKRDELEQARSKELDELTHAHATAVEQATAKQKAAEAALAHEKEKHSHTAQKLLEARSTLREHEARVKGLEEAAQRLGEEGQRTAAELQGRLDAATAQLQQVTAQWQEVERSYERLHKEMLLVLEQRDEARQQLQARQR